MYVLRLACLLSVFGVLYQLPDIAQPNSPPPNQQSKSEENNSTTKGISFKSQECEQPVNSQNPKPEDIPEKRLYHRYLRATILGVCVSMFLFGALIWQNILTRKSANAAQASADALMRIEKAWLYFWYEKFAHVNYQGTTIGTHDLAHHINWHCENAGKTPGFVVATWCRLVEIKSLEDLPPRPDYSMGKEIAYEGDPLRTGDKTMWFTAHLESTEAIRTFAAVETRHRSRQSFLYAYGFVRYRDVFGRSHVARFGVVYESEPQLSFEMDHWRVAGPATYNTYEENIRQ